ncbi:hypothetical protein [Vibrio phage vB_VibM_10AMN]|uniref:Uncharacterized protein n=1 Tax=Staphylococcus phage vB_VibM_10AMN12 TaxID=3076785 RepID=A0AA96KSF9_9CAUD|nr:hypothetical protein [Vibrio phage vB_VibM_10AMN]WNO47437.1 hypothetical protein [Staphylococcus phage vB_VibM_10AMN12]
MIKNIEFTHKHDGETFTVLAEYLDTSPLTFDKNNANCPTDLTGEREILDVVVLDANGEETSNNFVTDEVIWFEIDVCKNSVDDVRLDTTGLTYFDLWGEGESYYEE